MTVGVLKIVQRANPLLSRSAGRQSRLFRTGFRVSCASQGFTKEITHETNGPKPNVGDLVQVHYTGKFTDGKKFDSSHDRGQPLEFRVGKGMVIRGWDEGVLTMNLGEKAVITCQPEYAYGANGFPPVIPPNSVLVFDVELVDFKK